MVNDNRDHRRQPRRAGVLGDVALPDANDIAKHAVGHQALGAALVLHQDVHERVPAVERCGEQQVRVAPPQGVVDEARWNSGQLIQIESIRQVIGQYGPEL